MSISNDFAANLVRAPLPVRFVGYHGYISAVMTKKETENVVIFNRSASV